MSGSEFESWKDFYRQFPFDDLHRYHRPAAMLATTIAQTVPSKTPLRGDFYQTRLDFLAPDPIPPGMTAADHATMKAFRALTGKG